MPSMENIPSPIQCRWTISGFISRSIRSAPIANRRLVHPYIRLRGPGHPAGHEGEVIPLTRRQVGVLVDFRGAIVHLEDQGPPPVEQAPDPAVQARADIVERRLIRDKVAEGI